MMRNYYVLYKRFLDMFESYVYICDTKISK